MQFSWAVVVTRRCRVVVFERPEVIDKTGWGAQQHTTSHEAGMIDTASVLGLQLHRCMHETALIIQFDSTELSGVSFKIVLFIYKCMKRIAKICNLIYLYTELYQQKYLNKLLNMHERMNENIWTYAWVDSVRWLDRLRQSLQDVRSRVRVRMCDGGFPRWAKV